MSECERKCRLIVFHWEKNVSLKIKLTELSTLTDPAGDFLKITRSGRNKSDNRPDCRKFHILHVILQISLVSSEFIDANVGSLNEKKTKQKKKNKKKESLFLRLLSQYMYFIIEIS